MDRALLREPHAWLRESVPTYASLSISYDPRLIAFVELKGYLEDLASIAAGAEEEGKHVEIPVEYGGEMGPDLTAVARLSKLTEEDVVRIHLSKEYRCYMLGFMPGFLYLGELDERIVAPRLPSPRTKVPAGSVAVAGRQTGCYGIESPGGWQIIGRTASNPFDVSKSPPSSVLPGDWVSFVEVGL